MTQAKLITMDAGTLLATPLPPTRFIIGGILPQGLHILAGAPKIGKSWLALTICLRVASGEALWDFQVSRGTVLYLCLEDSFTRIQNRLFDIADDAPENLHFATMSEVIGKGLENQIENFLKAHPDTVLIVIDTLRRIRKVTAGINQYDVAENHTLQRVASFAFVVRRAPAPPPKGKCGLSPHPYGTEVTYGKDGFYPGQSNARGKENHHGKGAVLLPPAQRLHARLRP